MARNGRLRAQGTGPLRAPAKARLASRPIAQADAVCALLGEEAANVEQKLPLLGIVVFDFGGKKRCCDSACRSASGWPALLPARPA